MTREEIHLVDKKILELEIDQRNMRIFKEKDGLITVRIFSAEQVAKLHNKTFDLGKFSIKLVYGDFADLIKLMIPIL